MGLTRIQGWTRWSRLLLVATVALVVAACDRGEGTTSTASTTGASSTTAPATTTSEATTTIPEAAAELLVWMDENRAPVVEAIVPAFTEATGVDVTVEVVDFELIRDQIGVAGPAGEGPDVFVGAHDWTGELAANGIIAPIDLGERADDFVDVALQAFGYQGETYAVPFATEAVAMYYNTGLVGREAPASFEEIVDLCAGMDGIENCVGVPGGGDGADAYHNYPFVSGEGGYIFAYDPDTGYDPSDVGLDTEGAVAGVSFLKGLVENGVVAPTNYDTAKNLFLDGSEPFWITGPWERGTLAEQDAVDWAVAKLPTMEGNTPKPLVTAQGFFLSALSPNEAIAGSFLLDYVATPETMQALFETDTRNPAFTAVSDALGDDPVAQAFTASAADGDPIPNIPEMSAVWGPLGENLLLVRNGEAGAADAMSAAADRVRTAVAG